MKNWNEWRIGMNEYYEWITIRNEWRIEMKTDELSKLEWKTNGEAWNRRIMLIHIETEEKRSKTYS